MVWPFTSRAVVSVIRLEGVIAARGGAGVGGLNLAALEPALARAFAQGGARAVALCINSPGGSPVQSDMIVRRIRQLAEKHKKSVLTFVEDVGASGGYMLACAGDEIFVNPSSLVGSIGVIGGGFGFPDLMAKLGIERRVHTAGAVKGRLDPFQPEKPEDAARLGAILTQLHDIFIGFVRERRGARLKDDPMLFEGEIFTAREAVELGLADGFGDLNSVLAARYGAEVRLKRFAPSKPSLWRRLIGGAGEAALAALEERLAFSRYGL